MRRLRRLAGLAALVVITTVSPISEATILLALAVAVDVAALLALRHARPRPAPQSGKVLPIGRTGGSVYLRRRTVPELRLQHPAGVIEAQIRWRQASEARLRGRRIMTSVHPAD